MISRYLFFLIRIYPNLSGTQSRNQNHKECVLIGRVKLLLLDIWYGGFPKIVVPQNGWFRKPKTLLKWIIWGYHHLSKHPYTNHTPTQTSSQFFPGHLAIARWIMLSLLSLGVVTIATATQFNTEAPKNEIHVTLHKIKSLGETWEE